MSRKVSAGHELAQEDAAYRQLHSVTTGFEALVVACAGATDLRGPASTEAAVHSVGCVIDFPRYRLVDLLVGVGQVVVHPCVSSTRAGAPDPHVAIQRLGALVGPRVRLSTDVDPPVARSLPTMRVGEQQVGRRGLLGLRGTSGALPRHTAVDDEGRLLESLRWIGVRAPAGPGAPPVPASRRLVAQGCTACGMCVRTCPHDALHLQVSDGRATLGHRLAACHGTQECVTICPEGALQAAGPSGWADLLADRSARLAEVTVARCERCRGVHPAADGTLCRVCRLRRDNPFASFPTPTLR